MGFQITSSSKTRKRKRDYTQEEEKLLRNVKISYNNTLYSKAELHRQTRKARNARMEPIQRWIREHLHSPYPTPTERRELGVASGLSEHQVKVSLSNLRARMRNTIHVPDSIMTGPGASAPFVQGEPGRSATPTQFSNLSWTPASGIRGGRPATEVPRPQPAAVSQAPTDTQSGRLSVSEYSESRLVHFDEEWQEGLEAKRVERPIKIAKLTLAWTHERRQEPCQWSSITTHES
jgi:hypothetical protein